jgi:hypothetical protein
LRNIRRSPGLQGGAATRQSLRHEAKEAFEEIAGFFDKNPGK